MCLLREIVFEVVQALAGLVSCNTLFGQVIEDTKRLGESLRHCQFLHVSRDGNRLAHALVRRAISTADIDVWVKELPSDLDVVFQYEFPL